jgi:hypothetical protein
MGETKVFRENPPQCYFVHHKSHMTQPGIEPGMPQWEAINSYCYYHCYLIITVTILNTVYQCYYGYCVSCCHYGYQFQKWH